MFFKKKTADSAEGKYAAEWALHKPLFGGSLTAMNRALQKGADINWKNSDGMTALYYCCSRAYKGEVFSGYHLQVKNLLTLGADPNVLCTANQETALHALVARIGKFYYSGDFKGLAGQLIRSGGAITTNKSGVTPSDILRGLGHSPEQYWIERAEPEPQEQIEEADAPEETPTEPAAAPEQEQNPRWVPLGKDEIARVSVQSAIGYKITEIFNFAVKNYKSITQNLETKAETQVNKSFAELAQDDLVGEAQFQLDLSRTTVPRSEAATHKTKLRIIEGGQ